jgi:hypothetical protein
MRNATVRPSIEGMRGVGKMNSVSRRRIPFATRLGFNPTQVDYSDYRTVSGVKMPFKTTTTWTDGQSVIALSELQANAPIDAARFAKPMPQARWSEGAQSVASVRPLCGSEREFCTRCGPHNGPGARSAPSRHCQPAKGIHPDIKGRHLAGLTDRREANSLFA